MKKRSVIFLALMMGPFTWLYTYKKDKTKVWVMFSLSLVSLGILYVAAAYPWAILNALCRKSTTWEGAKAPGTRHKDVKYLVVLGAMVNTILLTLVAYGIAVGLTYMLLGSFTDVSTFDSVRAIFWIVLWVVVVMVTIAKILSRYDDYIVAYFRRGIYVISTLVVVGGICGMILVGTQGSKASSSACTIARTLQTARSAVVPIRTDQGSGTGFAISPDGKILTANHVIEGAKRIRISLTTGDIPLKVLSASKDNDLAVLKSSRPTPEFLPLDTDYKIADTVYAIGWPRNTYGAGGASVSKGIVSRVLNGDDLKLNGERAAALEVVQTDAALNPGNSGGPLISNCGAVGIVAAGSDAYQLHEYGIVSEQGISYAISSRTAKRIFDL